MFFTLFVILYLFFHSHLIIMKAVFIVLALCISFVLAQSSTTPFYITYPLQGDSFKAGNT